jgi:hypothetical protein
MNTSLSSRAMEYLQSSPGNRSTFSPEEVRERLRQHRIEISDVAASAISLLGSKHMLTLYDHVYWHGMDSVSSIFVSKPRPNWISICETRYPGSVYLSDDGALYFEDDLPSLWFRSFYKLVETQAAVFETLGTSEDFCARRVIRIETAESFAKSMSLRVEMSTLDRSVVLTGCGKIAVLLDAACDKTGVLLAAKDQSLLGEMIDSLATK